MRTSIYITLLQVLFISAVYGQVTRLTSSQMSSALNGITTTERTITSVNNTPTNNLITTKTSSNSFAAMNVTLPASSSVVSAFSNVTSKFGHYTAFYATLITVPNYRAAHTYYDVMDLINRTQSPINKQTGLDKLYIQTLESYLFFNTGMPGFIPYESDKPQFINISIGRTKPVNIEVDPLYQTYPLNNTTFVKNATLRY